MRTVECPKCGTDISDTYEGSDPSVGIMGAGWYCDACDLCVDDDGSDYHDDDILLSGTGEKIHTIARDRCPKCLSTNLEIGFGIAGGGYGPYSFCVSCGTVVHKSQEPTNGNETST